MASNNARAMHEKAKLNSIKYIALQIYRQNSVKHHSFEATQIDKPYSLINCTKCEPSLYNVPNQIKKPTLSADSVPNVQNFKYMIIQSMNIQFRTLKYKPSEANTEIKNCGDKA